MSEDQNRQIFIDKIEALYQIVKGNENLNVKGIQSDIVDLQKDIVNLKKSIDDLPSKISIDVREKISHKDSLQDFEIATIKEEVMRFKEIFKAEQNRVSEHIKEYKEIEEEAKATKESQDSFNTIIVDIKKYAKGAMYGIGIISALGLISNYDNISSIIVKLVAFL